MLTKTIGLTVKDYKIILTSPLKFYKGDDLTLYFEVGEFGASVVEDNDIYSPLFPEDAFLFVETPNNIDTIEAVSIEGNKLCFRLTDKYTSNLGTSRMQIVLLDGYSRKALPPFEFEIQPIIYEEQPDILYNGLWTEDGISLMSEDSMLLDSTDEVYGIKISELPWTEDVEGFIPIVQHGETKRVDVQQVIGQATDFAREYVSAEIMTTRQDLTNYVDAHTQESIDILVPTMIQEEIITTVPTMIQDSIDGDISTMVDEKLSGAFSYENPISSTIVDYKTALDYLLYFDLSISFSCNQSTNLEMGAVVNSVNFNWSYNKDNITYQSFNGTVLDNTVRAYLYDVPFSSNKTFTLIAKDDRKQQNRTISFKFSLGRYWGVSSSSSASGEEIASFTKELSSTPTKTFTVSASDGQYIYYCYPTSWGESTFFVGGFEGGFTLIGNAQVMNTQGYITEYRVYRSTNHSLGSTTVEVQKLS